MVDSKHNLDYKLIAPQINRLLESVPNKLEREWPKLPTFSTPAASFVVFGTTKVLGNTFNATRFLSSEKSPDYRHGPELALAVPPLARTISDTLYTFIFLFEDLAQRAEWYMRSGWRELAEYIDRSKRDYGSDAGWKAYFAQAEPKLHQMASLIGRPPEELRTTKWWPTPAQMKGMAAEPATAKFFGYLDDWFNREFSQISHLSLPGLIHSAGALLDRDQGDDKILKMRGYHFMQVVMLLISIYSEIEATLKIGISADLKYVWQTLIQHYPFSTEFYDARHYAARL